MKKSLKIILIIVFIIVVIYITYENIILPRLPRVEGIIVAKDNKTITLKDSVDSTERSYILNIGKKPIIKDIDGRKINISDLNIGDIIFATYGREGRKMASMVATNPPSISGVKLVQVKESNKDGHISEGELSYNKFVITKFQFEKNYIALGIDLIDKFPNDYLTGNCSIIQNEQSMKKITIEPTKISLKKESNNEIEIDIDTDNLINELEIGKYIFIFENEELGLIKIPFEKNINGTIISNH